MNRANADRLNRIKTDIADLQEKLKDVPEQQKGRADSLIAACESHLKEAPHTDIPVHIHIIGTDKSYKTSYLLDLFDNEELRKLFDIPQNTSTEHTAVPCLIQPAKVDNLQIQRLSTKAQIIDEHISPPQFRKFYDLEQGARPGGYMLRILLPEHNSKMLFPVIEYPGMKKEADASEKQNQIHQILRDDMIQTLKSFPGILVACFYKKVTIPPGHPMDTILKEYASYLRTDHNQHKLPLILSLQGREAVMTYCGNTNVLQDIQKDFKSYELFDSTIQLTNPSHSQYPVNFGKKGNHVDEWIHKLSNYKDLNEIQENINKDGGISWSIALLEKICKYSHIREALDNIYLRPWIEENEKFLEEALLVYDEIKSFDIVLEIHAKLKESLNPKSYKYRTLRQCFNDIFTPDMKSFTQQKDLWEKVCIDYLKQFFAKQDDCKNMAEEIWKRLLEKIDPYQRGFISTREEDVSYIILNIAEIYIPNALLRGEPAIYGRVSK